MRVIHFKFRAAGELQPLPEEEFPQDETASVVYSSKMKKFKLLLFILQWHMEAYHPLWDLLYKTTKDGPCSKHLTAVLECFHDTPKYWDRRLS